MLPRHEYLSSHCWMAMVIERYACKRCSWCVCPARWEILSIGTSQKRPLLVLNRILSMSDKWEINGSQIFLVKHCFGWYIELYSCVHILAGKIFQVSNSLPVKIDFGLWWNVQNLWYGWSKSAFTFGVLHFEKMGWNTEEAGAFNHCCL